MATCPKLAEGEVVRVTRVDSCGGPVETTSLSDGDAFIDDCWASVEMSANYDEGTEIDFRAMNGASCGYRRGLPSFRGYNITGSFYSASPELVDILTGNPLYTDFNGDNIGWDDCGVQNNFGVGLEIWQNIVGEDCPDTGSEGLFWYWLIPWMNNVTLGDVTVGQEGVTFTFTANTRSGGNWDLGPWDVQAQDAGGTAGPLLTPLGSNCHRRSFLTTIAPPTALCGYVAVPPNNFVS